MPRALRFLILLPLFATVVGCTESWVRPDLFAEFPNRLNRFDIHFAWRTVPSADSLQVQGVASNVRYAYVEDLELQIALVDRMNRPLARESFFFIPPQFPRDETRPFSITLKEPAPQGARLQFLYKYRVNDGLDQFPWAGTFTTDAASGAFLGGEE